MAQSGIAVVAQHYWQAKKALDALPMEWDDGPGGQWKTQEQVVQALREAIEQDAGQKVDVSRGQAVEVLGRQPRIVEAMYHAPFADQATMASTPPPPSRSRWPLDNSTVEDARDRRRSVISTQHRPPPRL